MRLEYDRIDRAWPGAVGLGIESDADTPRRAAPEDRPFPWNAPAAGVESAPSSTPSSVSHKGNRMTLPTPEESKTRLARLFDMSQDHRRVYRRNEVNMPAFLTVLNQDERVYTRGTALVKNLSMQGALLTNLKLRRGAFPANGFIILLRMKGPKVSGVRARCRPVRFTKGRELGLGVEFDELWVETRVRRRRKKKAE